MEKDPLLDMMKEEPSVGISELSPRRALHTHGSKGVWKCLSARIGKV
jgi:hypothetical protein